MTSFDPNASRASVSLARCKYSDCRGDITREQVRKVTAIPKAPHHVAIVATCGLCTRTGQYVVPREEFENSDFELVEPSAAEKQLRAARIEVDAIDSADDLFTLWRSLKAPPIIEEHVGKCICRECVRKRYA